jgi:hypothetical protein
MTKVRKAVIKRDIIPPKFKREFRGGGALGCAISFYGYRSLPGETLAASLND